MSRSYRKHFWFPTEGDKRNKKWFNRKLRHKHVVSGGNFKKQNNSRDIHCFWIHYVDEEDYVRQNLGYGWDEETLRKTWRKYFLSK